MRIAPCCDRVANSPTRFSILAPRRHVSLLNFRWDIPPRRRVRPSVGTRRVRWKLPKFGNRKTDSSTFSRARSCSSCRSRRLARALIVIYGEADAVGVGVGVSVSVSDGDDGDSVANGSSFGVPFVSKITLPPEISSVLRLV